MENTCSEKLAPFVEKIHYEDLSAGVVQMAKNVVFVPLPSLYRPTPRFDPPQASSSRLSQPHFAWS